MSSRPPHDRRAEFEAATLPLLDSLFNMALALTRQRRDAEDLVQEAYLRAWRFFDSYEPGTNVRAWMFRILRNEFVNRYRAARARPTEVDLARIEAAYDRAIDETFLAERHEPSPEEALLAGVGDEQVERALGEIPPQYREVVILALVEELSYKEIASALSIPVGTVMSRLHRGRKLLQSALLDHVRARGILRQGPGVQEAGHPRPEGPEHARDA